MTEIHTQSPLRHDTDAELPAAAFLRYESRADGWSAGWQAAFLSHFADHGVVADAARAVGKSLAGGYALRRTARGYAFNLGWEAAVIIARRVIEDQLLTAAVKGEQSRWVREEGVTTFTRQNSKLSLALLNRVNPATALPEVIAVATRFDVFLQLIDDGVSAQEMWDYLFDDALPLCDAAARERVRVSLQLCEETGDLGDKDDTDIAPIEYKSMDAALGKIVPQCPGHAQHAPVFQPQWICPTDLFCGSRSSPSRRRKPALPLLHLDLLGNADRILRIGFGDGAVIHSLTAQCADVVAQVKHKRRCGLFGPCWWCNPIDSIQAIWVGFAFRRFGNSLRIFGNRLGLFSNLGRTSGGWLLRLNLRRASVHVFGILLGRGRFEIDADDCREHRQSNADAAGDLLILWVDILVEKDQSEQRQECNNCDNRAQLVLHKETETIGTACRIMLVCGFPHQAAGNRKHRDTNQYADQQREVSVVKRPFFKEDDAGDFGANGHNPRQARKDTKVCRFTLLALRRCPRFCDVYCSGRIVLGHDLCFPHQHFYTLDTVLCALIQFDNNMRCVAPNAGTGFNAPNRAHASPMSPQHPLQSATRRHNTAPRLPNPPKPPPPAAPFAQR